jgi:hypothetical protein
VLIAEKNFANRQEEPSDRIVDAYMLFSQTALMAGDVASIVERGTMVFTNN